MDEPQTGDKGDKSKESIGDLPAAHGVDPTGKKPATTPQHQEKQSSDATNYSNGWVRLLKAAWLGIAWFFTPVIAFLDKNSGAVTAVATIAIGVLTWEYVSYSKRQWEAMTTSNGITQTTLNVGQRAYVTIGRNDGVVAEFVVPRDPAQNAEMVIYFQNTGHIPAKFGWGVMAGLTSSKTSGIAFSHHWTQPFRRTFDKKQSAIGESGDSTIIAGGSIYVATMGVISQKDLSNLPTTSPGMFILGIYQYCDELGNQDMRQFEISYRTSAPSSALSFTLGNDTSWLNVLADAQKKTPDTLFPCETIAEKQQHK